IVEAVGSGVTHLKVGDRVAYGQSPLGAYAEAGNVPADRVVRIPHGLTFEQAAAVMRNGLTCCDVLRQTYRLHDGPATLSPAAAGGVGLYACQWARALGVKLIGTVSSPEKAALAKENGAWEVIDYSHEDVVQRVLELTNGQKVPVVYDGVGKDTWERSLDCLQPRGLMVSFGNASGPVTVEYLETLASQGSVTETRLAWCVYVASSEIIQDYTYDVYY